jgi:hypothetical protein
MVFKKQTAVSQVILKMKDAKENIPPFGFDEEFVRGFNKAFQMAIFISEQVGLPMEKEQIIEHHTWLLSGVMGEESARQDAEQYYKKSYGE